MRNLIFTTGRLAGHAPRIALAVIAIAVLIAIGWIGPEDYPPQCETRHPGHTAYVAEHPGECE